MERDIAQAEYASVRARLQTPSPHGCRALDMSREEVMDSVQIPKSPPSHPRPDNYQLEKLGEEIMGDLCRRYGATRVNCFRDAQARLNCIQPGC
jgi:hypothetical protein